MIQVGQVLDKYELLERVGQGGMAVVYRGLDRQLKRTVAIKILHRHLSDYQEARDRFEREAQAVAKLRHENILEIFDYSAKEGGESYIVTEFIDGQTLKQFITERPMQYPEVGAMVMLQVCRALSHAHAGGILHRDIKPENIMIRSDGLVKLMDFGISHMVDLERLTVTGQLLGSPAYMAPEHVEGRQLDFRTDVFAVGIVLYQLCVGKLPFEGKNPHEVLKRIAECKFVDPRQANPRIGNRLGRIILKAMAAAPNDRYPAIGEMVLALEAYLEESGLPTDKLSGELSRYFKAPAAYEHTLKDRLVDALTRRGQTLLDDDNQAGALDVFDRVLTIDPQNAKVLSILDRINRRARLKTVGLAALAIVVLSGGAFLIHDKMQPPEPEAPPDPETSELATTHGDPSTHTVPVENPPIELDAGVDASVDAPAIAIVDPPRTKPDATLATSGVATEIRVSPSKDSEYQYDQEPWLPVPSNGLIALTLDHDTAIHVRNTSGCCEPNDTIVKPGAVGVTMTMLFLPGHVIPKCGVPVEARVGGKVARLDQPFTIPFDQELSRTKTVKVEFIGNEHVDHTPIAATVTVAGDVEVKCVQR